MKQAASSHVFAPETLQKGGNRRWKGDHHWKAELAAKILAAAAAAHSFSS